MDYEKAYKAVLQTAKQWIKDGCTDKEKICLESIFPELRESEDELMIGSLIEFLRCSLICDDVDDERINAWVAWLEKQKEQKPADEQFPPLEGLDAIKAKYYDDGFKNGFDEGVESVKPAEWSEEDKTRLTNILIMLQEYVIHHYSKDDVNKSVDWLKALPERFNLQPKKEWSEEDEKMWMDIKSHMIHGSFIPFDKIEWIENRLKSLRPQPHWKPSEEQMEALESEIKYCYACGLHEGGRKLQSLYEQLKKL